MNKRFFAEFLSNLSLKVISNHINSSLFWCNILNPLGEPSAQRWSWNKHNQGHHEWWWGELCGLGWVWWEIMGYGYGFAAFVLASI